MMSKEMALVNKISLIFVIVVLIAGCDRVQYEVKKLDIAKSASNTYMRIRRVPLDGQIDLCIKEVNSKTNPVVNVFMENMVKCMKAGGYRLNDKYSQLLYRRVDDGEDASALNNQTAIDMTLAGASPVFGVPAWIEQQ